MLQVNRKSGIWAKGLWVVILTVGILLVASYPAGAQEEKPIYPGYPLSFDGRGILDEIGSHKITISDHGLTLASGATFNLPDALNSGPSGFRIGDQVAFLLNSKGEIESIWLIKRSEKKKK